MNNKKEQERAELHSTIWKIANDLRGSVDGWDFKQYVLGILFYRFISENLSNYIDREEHKTGNKTFNYAELSDKEAEIGRKETVEEKGFYILPSELFENVRKRAKKDSDLNITLNTVFNNIENSAKGMASEEDMRGLFDDLDVNNKKLGNTVIERNANLVKLLDAIGALKIGDYQDNTIDAFGDAYEYLMTMYASNAGKSGGEFFTPQEVGELLAKITLIGKTSVNKVYDPACGSGSLLLKFAKVLGKENVKQGFYGQEKNLTTYNLCRINMFLHDINYNNFNIAHGDTLINPKHWNDEPFDAIVSNPPYSIRWEGKSNPLLINDPRFSPAGILAPEAKADLAFTMHMLTWLSQKGTAAIVEFPGVLYRGGAEQKIREYLIDNNFVDAIIQLPSDLFFGTSIATCIIVLKRSKSDNNILFLDATEEFVRGTNKSKLSDENIENVLTLLKDRKNVARKAILISNEEVIENDCNLSTNTYLKTDKDVAIIAITEHNQKLKEIVEKQSKIRKELDTIIAEIESTLMDKVEELIKEFCPNGVEYKKIGEVANLYYGKGNNIPKDGGQYPVYGCNGIVGFTSNYNNENTPIVGHIGSAGLVMWGEGKHYVTYNGTICNPIPSIIKSRYLYHVLCELRLEKKVKGSQPFLSVSDFESIKISIPPLSVQEEIVKILDKFLELEEDLEKELVARKVQYGYYRRKLLSFEELSYE